MSAVGVPYVKDLNTGRSSGAKRVPFTIKDGTRASAYDAYYAPIQKRSNLDAVTYGRVERINVKDNGGKLSVTGVTYTDQNLGMTMNVTARKEVIVSAGAVPTPQILMLSVSRREG